VPNAMCRREVAMAISEAETPSRSGHQLAPSHCKISVKTTYLTHYLPRNQHTKREGGEGARISKDSPSMSCEMNLNNQLTELHM